METTTVGGRRLLYITAFLRATATGLVGVQLGIYLTTVGSSIATVGYVVAAGLAGAASASLVATLWGDVHGRRRLLIEVTLLGATGALLLAVSSNPVVLAVPLSWAC